MANTIVNGMQWGDEGKGKIVDLLCPAFEAVVRYQGGDNAGHTVKFADRHFALHLVPSGILHPGMNCVLASGMVVNPETLFHEMSGLEEAGISFGKRFYISNRAHVLLPLYRVVDGAREAAMGKGKIGTTARGIGPAYESKAARYGVRMCDLLAADLVGRIEALLDRHQRDLEAGGEETSASAVVDQARAWGERLKPYLTDTEELINGWIDQGRSVMFEGAQGALLDLDHGTYPFVTSSSPAAGGACTGSGVPPSRISGVIGVLKAYTTRVGGGPFVTELQGEHGEHLQERGNEFGTTTGRPRRCGWLDAVVARHSRMISGVGSIALTKLDVLDELDEIKVCTGYRIGRQERTTIPARFESLEEAQPIYRTFPGWQRSTVGILDFDDLPEAARNYVMAIEEMVGAPIGLVSTGPRREETIVRDEPAFARLVSTDLESIRQRSRAT
jgi:adenylosuccinate synthase